MKKVLAATALLFAAAAFAVDAPTLTGRWTIHNSIAGNESDMPCTFIQTDAKLTGSCKSNDKDQQITGSVDGKKLTWKYESDYNGSPLTLTYTATLEDAGKFAGSVDVQPFGVTGDFTATPITDAGK